MAGGCLLQRVAVGQKQSLGMDLLSAYQVVSEANSFAHPHELTWLSIHDA